MVETIDMSAWSKIITAVTTPLGFLVLIVLVLSSVLIGYASFAIAQDKYFFSVLALLVFLIVVVVLLGLFKPEALRGERRESVTDELATIMGIEIYTAFDGYLPDESRSEAYGMFHDLCLSRVEILDDPSKQFVDALVSAVQNRARVFETPEPKGHLATPGE